MRVVRDSFTVVFWTLPGATLTADVRYGYGARLSCEGLLLVSEGNFLFYQPILRMSRSNHRLSVLLVLSCGLLAGAAEKPRVALVPFATGEGASDAAAARFSALVLAELKGRADALELAAAPTGRGGADKQGKRGPSAEALAALEGGRKAFEDLRFEDASASLKKAIEGLLADPSTADFEAVADADVKLAASSFRMGEEKDAKLALAELCRLSPAYALPPGFPPVFQRELEKAKKRVEKAARGALSIDGPPGSTAFVDGRDLGMVPIADEVLPIGLHYVKVEGPKGERFGQTVDLKASARARAVFSERGAGKPSEAPVEPPRIAASLDEAALQRVAAWARAVGADYALVGYVYKTSESQLTAGTALFSVRKNAFTALQTVSFDADVITANTEAFRLADDVVKRLTAFAPAFLPINLAAKLRPTAVVKSEPRLRLEDAEPAPRQKKPVALVPPEARVESTRTLQNPSVVEVDPKEQPGEPPPEVKPNPVPVWVWVVTGVVVAAGVGVGGYFGYTAITKPVTGTVTATW
jgi:hypothetical protein